MNYDDSTDFLEAITPLAWPRSRALGFAAGVVVLMLWLAGWFSPKTPATAAASQAQALTIEGQLVNVQLIRLPLSESAVGTIPPCMKRPSARNCWPESSRSTSRQARRSRPASSRAAGRHGSSGQAPAGQGGRDVARGRPRASRQAMRSGTLNWSSPMRSAATEYEKAGHGPANHRGGTAAGAGDRQRSAGDAGLGHHPLPHRRHGDRQEGRRGRHGHARPDARSRFSIRNECSLLPACASR